ncbi:MAG: hypothetical protein JXA54_06870 [Candidatus Heimdallarchaeota archaeon]|nr:hypothetical protein [Candidatus Heimdallarchaeota archaeon]
MKIETFKDKIKYEIHICEQCAGKKDSFITIFRMKRTRVRTMEPCTVCQTQTNLAVTGIADSELEVNQMIAKLK